MVSPFLTKARGPDADRRTCCYCLEKLVTLLNFRQIAKRRDSSSSTASTPRTSDSGSSYTIDYRAGRKSPERTEPVTPTTPTLRKDDFFDQRPAGRDYSSVIDSMSTTTDQDSAHDFDSYKRNNMYSKQLSSQGPTLVIPESTESQQDLSTRSNDSERDAFRPKTSRGYREVEVSPKRQFCAQRYVPVCGTIVAVFAKQPNCVFAGILPERSLNGPKV